MLRQISNLLEIMSIFVCIHRLYGRRVKANIGIAAAYLGCLVIYCVMDIYGSRIILTLMSYLAIGIYCIHSQKDSLKGAMLSVVLMIIILAIVQFIYILPLNLLLRDDNQKAFAVNLFALISFIWILPKSKLSLLRKETEKNNGLTILMFGAGIYSALLLVLQGILNAKLLLRLFVFLLLLMAFSYLAIEKWNEVQNEKKSLEKELQAIRIPQEKYEELLKMIRIRQHEFRNHLAAIWATQYTYKSYDKLVKAQNDYCGRLIQDNRHYKLLLIENKVLAGFLYGKLQEIEAEGVSIECEIRGTFRQSVVPIHHLIEMLGILLDNAVQAKRDSDSKETGILFSLLEKGQSYQFKVCNRFPYTSYDEIATWFQLGESTKGEGHGLGLYQLRCLCKESGCIISYGNVEIKEENWIEFVLEVHEADRE
nr:GHKL domain-containing protein [uncultured Acetatifactor sp.]